MSRPLTALLGLAALAVAGCGGSAGSGPVTGTAASAGCVRVPRPAPKDTTVRRPRRGADPGHRYVATLTTNCGTIQIRLDAARQPRTVGSFVSLVRHGFYRGLTFHRIARDPHTHRPWVIQGGDPHGDGSGDPGYTIVERPPHDATYTRRTVAMAKAPNQPAGASGSQFFVVCARHAALPPDYALLGRVIAGMSVVRRIAALPVVPKTERPRQPVVIEAASVSETP